MNRRYTTEEYEEVINNLREKIPDVAIITDVMVGFMRNRKEFLTSLDFVEKMCFSKVHVFKYSPRKGTPAYSYPNQVSAKEKERRSKLMIEIALKNEKKFYEQFKGREMEVLLNKKLTMKIIFMKVIQVII